MPAGHIYIHLCVDAADLPSAVKAQGVPFQPQSQLSSCLIQSLYKFSQPMPYKQSSFVWDFYPWLHFRITQSIPRGGMQPYASCRGWCCPNSFKVMSLARILILHSAIKCDTSNRPTVIAHLYFKV